MHISTIAVVHRVAKMYTVRCGQILRITHKPVEIWGQFAQSIHIGACCGSENPVFSTRKPVDNFCSME